MWAEILMMYANLPGEHKKQELEYREKMECLRSRRCESILDTRDNIYVIRLKPIPNTETKTECSSTETQSVSACEIPLSKLSEEGN